MKALVWHGTRSLAYEDVDEPAAGPDEVVLEVSLAGICGSDLHGYRGHPGPRVPPLVLGHEVVGTVDGERYALYPLVGCGACARCEAGEDNLCASWRLVGMHRAGVFAERVAVPRRCLVPVPPGLDDRRAVLAEPLACCVG
ncbi:MAG TPA: alcohol dehydrogenase catalytic domain-containing protein, partial [Gaiellaceae bacterium]|nr:alcohol dehydrogenase catalytic domain-containing protein [Gaiellaceae bacterium]